MNARSATPFDTTTPDRPDGWMRPLMTRQIEALGQMAEAGFEVVMDLKRQALEGPGDGAAAVGPEALALAFARVSRAVRMTFALQYKAMKDLQYYDHFAPDPAASPSIALNDAPAAYADLPPEDRRLNRVQRILEQVIEAEHGQDTDASERLVELSIERLVEREDLYDNVLSRPLSAVVVEICQDLGLTPDWSLLVNEPWARQEIDGGMAGSPLADWMADPDPPRSSSSVFAKRKTEDPASPPSKRGAPGHPRGVNAFDAGFPRHAWE